MVSQCAGRVGLTTTQWATLLARCGSSLSQSYLLSLDLKFRWILKKSKDSGDQNSGDQNLRILVIKLLNVGDPPGGQDWPSVSGPWFACSLHSSPLPNDWGRLCSLRWEPQQEGEDLHGICLASKGRRPGVAGKEHGWKCEIMLFLLRQQLVRSSLTTRESSTSRSGNPWDARYSPLRFGKWSYDNFSTTFKFDLKLPLFQHNLCFSTHPRKSLSSQTKPTSSSGAFHSDHGPTWSNFHRLPWAAPSWEAGAESAPSTAGSAPARAGAKATHLRGGGGWGQPTAYQRNQRAPLDNSAKLLEEPKDRIRGSLELVDFC